jgi:hypothetical protein
MQEILKRRWLECTACIAANAPLAATVMMGGLLEGLLLARINRETNKAPIFTAVAAPRDKQNQTLPLKEWTLQHYIDVAHELTWLSATAKDIGVVLRDYRNYIHPHKELTHAISLQKNDAAFQLSARSQSHVSAAAGRHASRKHAGSADCGLSPAPCR